MQRKRQPKVKTSGEYKNAIKLLRKFADGFSPKDGVDLRKPISELSPYQRRKIRKYFDIIEPLTARNHKVVRPRRKDHLRELQELAGHQGFPKGIKAALIPVADPSKSLKIEYTRKHKVRRVIEDGKVYKYTIFFDRDLLLSDAMLAAIDVVNRAPLDATQFLLGAAEHEIQTKIAPTAADLAYHIQRLQDKYGIDQGYDATNPSSKWFGNWMFSVNSYTFKSKKTMDDYLQAKFKAKELLKEIRSIRGHGPKSQKRRKELLTRYNKFKIQPYQQKIDN